MRDAFRLGEWLVEPDPARISRGDRTLHLRARVMDLLVFLAEHPGDVLSKDEILDKVWGAKFVSESSLTTTVTEIRQAFEDDVEHPWLIETIPKRGYRLIAVPELPKTEAPHAAGRFGVTRTHRWLLGGVTLIAAAILVVVSIHRPTTAGPARRIVIVMPLKNGTGDPSQDYFAGGVGAALTDALWRIHAVSIVSNVPEEQRAKLLAATPTGTAVVLDGVISRGSDRVLAEVWLDDASTHVRLWSARYDRPVGDIVAVYDDIATALAIELHSTLDAASPARRVDPAAYDEYLRGRYGASRWMTGGCIEAEEHLLRATELDREFVAPLLELGYCYVYPNRLRRPTTETGPKARAVVAKALELDPRSGLAHALKAIIGYRLDYDWARAAAEFALASGLEPGNATVCNAYGEFLYLTGRVDDGLRQERRALELNPFILDMNVAYGFGLFMNRREAEAAGQFRHTLMLHPDATIARFWLAEAEARLGHDTIAAREYLAWLNAAGRPDVLEASPRAAVESCRAGRWQDCERLDLSLMDAENQRPGSVFYGFQTAGPYRRARRYARAGLNDRAIDALQHAYQERQHQLPYIGIDPAFDGLRDDARFRELRRVVGPPAK